MSNDSSSNPKGPNDDRANKWESDPRLKAHTALLPPFPEVRDGSTSSPGTKMLSVTISTAGVNAYEAQEWVYEMGNIYADMEIEGIAISGDNITFKARWQFL